ncbi:hypothetical protein CONPUDRAFT_60819 [Coniophora puteana RWD-64-598 SS2]|uniref:Uncharacterized protein n=1 Tax=Coniophora puteana (strain RWD-64-598) TaxID=741705 RepID=A0A5M3MI42_CONPW|nr:uncharacterized protein CONPUDRAFT_60819 [Coniophora puteana RWD-64-598 SS2]EIW78676.1 hypothetical protein CONPUDRAFT_60819 [Coniophora puteana RWD-64-598 SS2]
MASIVTIDDRDASIRYSGSWITSGTYPEYKNTTSASTQIGDTATFAFTGTWVSVYGTTGWTSTNGVPTTQYTVDGGSPVSFTAPNVTGFPLYHYQMFASDALNDTTHTLVIKNTSPSCPCNTWFDFIEYIPSQSNCMAVVSFV